jgi:WD40 repeat protein
VHDSRIPRRLRFPAALLLGIVLCSAGARAEAEEDEGPARCTAAEDEVRSVLRFEAGTERVRSLAWSPSGARLVAGCSDRTLRIWSPDKAKPLASHVLPRYG